MGLDMYLHRRTYVKNWDHNPVEKKWSIVIKRGGKAIPKDMIDPAKVSSIEEEVAYWRKANAVHDWFINNCAKGEDDCRDVYVEPDQLKELVELCKNVLASAKTNKPIPKATENWQEWDELKIENEDEIKELLPTAEGFFFGSTEYDGTYLYDLMLTIEQLEPAIASYDKHGYESGDFYYRASW